jgi:hypothetical protein
MTKFTGKNMLATFGSTGFTCLTSLDVSETAEVFTASCAGSTYKARVVGTTDATFTINYIADTTDSTYSDLTPGTTGTFTASLNATAWAQYSGSGIIESLSHSAPVDGFVTGTVVIGIDGALTVT